MKNFVVTFNRNMFRTTTNRKMIVFINETKVVEVLDEDFPSMIYKFKSFNELAIVENLNDAEMFGKFLILFIYILCPCYIDATTLFLLFQMLLGVWFQSTS